MLVQIAARLSQVERAIGKLSQELHRDRVAEINAGISMVSVSLKMKSATTRNTSCMMAAQTLHVGLHKTNAELSDTIANAPATETSFWDYLSWTDKTEKARNSFANAQESLHTATTGLRALAECYAMTEEPEASVHVLNEYFQRIFDCNIDMAIQKSRLVRATGSQLPQTPWKNFKAAYVSAKSQLANLDASLQSCVGIEFTLPELMEGPDHGKVPEMPAPDAHA